MKLTRKMIDDGKSHRGAWNARQLAILGVPWPPLKGWPERIIGTEISDEKYAEFLAIRKVSKLPHPRNGVNVLDVIRAKGLKDEMLANLHDDGLPPISQENNAEFLRLMNLVPDEAQQEIDRLKARIELLDDKLSTIYAMASLATDDTVRESIRRCVDSAQMPRVDISELGPAIANLPNPHDQSAEAFANSLFEATGRDLG